jgi:hypothetical protein
MTTFSRLVESPVHAFQFRKIELDKAYENSDPSFKTHLQLDEQFAAFKKANLMVNIGVFEFAPVTDPEDLTLIITCNSFGQSRFKSHELKLGDWLVIEPMMLPLNGIVMTDQDFQDEYGQYAPRTEDDLRSEQSE